MVGETYINAYVDETVSTLLMTTSPKLNDPTLGVPSSAKGADRLKEHCSIRCL